MTNEEQIKFIQLIEDVAVLKATIANNNPYPLKEKWLDIQETCLLLKVSKRTLQSYRDNGTLPFSQIGSKIYYKATDIDKHLEKNYRNNDGT